MNTNAFKNESKKETDTQQLKLIPEDSFNPLKLRTMLRNWIVETDGSFIQLESAWLQRAFEYCNPASLQALVTGNTIKSDILNSYEANKKLLKKQISVF